MRYGEVIPNRAEYQRTGIAVTTRAAVAGVEVEEVRRWH